MTKKLTYLFCVLFSVNAWAQKYSEVAPIVRISPAYPAEQLKVKQEGWVKVKFDVTTKGNVENAMVVDSEPKKVFDRAAIEAVLKFKFKPRIVDGEKVKATVTQTIEFDLPDVAPAHNVSVPIQSNSSISYELKHHKIKKLYHSTLLLSDSKTQQLIKEIKLSSSKDQQPFLAQSKTSPYLFYYFRKGKKNAQVNIYSKENFSLLHEVMTEPLYFTSYQHRNNYFFSIGPNGVDLLAMMSASRKPKLVTINGLTGKLTTKKEFEKNTLLKGTADMKYLWARKVSTAQTTSARFNKTTNNSLKFIKTDNFEVFREIKLQQKLISAKYWGQIIQLLFEYKNQDPKYRAMFLNLSTNEFYDDFYSSTEPLIYSVDGPYTSIMIAGTSPGRDKHLKLVQFKANEFIDLSNKKFYLKYNDIDFKHNTDVFYMHAYGDGSFGRLNINNPNEIVQVEVPMDVANGFFTSNHDTVFLNEKHGSKIALVDIKDGKLINTVKTGSTEKKVGQIFASLLTMAITAPTGYMVTPLGGFRSSTTKMFVNAGDKRVFVINYKTNDVTSFDAKDLSDKHIVDTGKGTFQIIQATFESDLPVVVIGLKKVTFLDPNTGRMLKQISYDKPLDITENNQLSYMVDDQIKIISLAYLE